MSAQRLFVLALIGAALLTAHQSFGSPTELEQEVGETVAHVTHVARLRSTAGRAGAVVVGPFVRSLTTDTERMVRDLGPAMDRAQARDARRARKLRDTIAQLDSAAHASIEEGRPIAALKLASEGRSLVSAVRQILAEETAFR